MERQPLGVACRYGVGVATICVGILSVLVHPAPAAAATATATLTVSANVISSCTVTDGALAFGPYSPTATGNVDQTGTFTVSCTKGTGASVGLGDGNNFLSGARRMLNGTEYLTYELYKESARTNVWGNSGGAAVTVANAASNAAQTLTVYGRIPPGQDVGVGNFGDSVQITVTY
jgi:spore coat protein U-like protein